VPVRYPPLVWMLILFLVVAAVSVLSLDRGNSVGLLLNGFIKVVGASLALAWLISTRAQLRFAMMAMIGLGSVVALKALYNKVAGIDLVEGTRVTIGRTIGSPLGDPNDLALVLLFPLCIALAFMLFGKGGWARVFSALGVVVILAGIVATQSRGGLLGVLAVCFVLGQYYIRSKAVTIAGVVIAALGLVAMMGLSERQSGGFDTYSEAVELDQSASDRLVAWMAGVNMAVSHPLSGVGMGNFTTFYYAYTPEWKGRPKAAHSAWFNALGETGFPGFIVFIGFVVSTVALAWRDVSLAETLGRGSVHWPIALGLFAGLVGFCVSASFLTQTFSWPIYLYAAFTVAHHAILVRSLEPAGAAVGQEGAAS